MKQPKLVARSPKTWTKQNLYALIGLSLLIGAASSSAALAADAVRTASLPPANQFYAGAEIPSILQFDDVQRYRRIFALQAAGNWSTADQEIARLSDRLLVGAVLADRYLGNNYRSRYSELSAWLDAYADEPPARAIFALAEQRRPEGAAPLKRPGAAQVLVRMGDDDGSDATATGDGQSRDAADAQRALRLKDEIRRAARSNPAKAETLLGGPEARQLLSPSDIDEAHGFIAEGYFTAGETRRARAIAVTETGSSQPRVEWEAGLSDWRLKRYAEARKHFESAAKSPAASGALSSAAAFWAARTALRNRHPELVNYWLGLAAQQPYTFYGLLARRTLGVDTFFNFDIGAFSKTDAAALANSPAGRRVLALIQVGDYARAEAHIRSMAGHTDTGLTPALEALADRAGMPALSFQLAAVLSLADGRNHDRSLFPLPRWEPKGGFVVDRAFMFALMRQESQFLTRVESHSGAIGVMQLMPATARSMAARLGLSAQDRRNLTDPEINIALAQEYVASLQENDRIGNNLILIATAYNSGPGPIQRWLASPELRQDPLLFLESIPQGETRAFTQRVLANYWIYRQRLGQPTPDLDALAAGNWPTYTALDGPSGKGARYAEN